MVKLQPSKLARRVRFPLPAPSLVARDLQNQTSQTEAKRDTKRDNVPCNLNPFQRISGGVALPLNGTFPPPEHGVYGVYAKVWGGVCCKLKVELLVQGGERSD